MKRNGVAAPGRYVCLSFLNDTGSFPRTEIIVLRDHFENYWEQLAGMVVGTFLCPAQPSLSYTSVPLPVPGSAHYYVCFLLLRSLLSSSILFGYMSSHI